MKEIKLTQGKVALVDNEDFEWLNSFRWSALKKRNTYYARACINGKLVFMHQMIAENRGFKHRADHVDRNGLNNQNNNLRDATQVSPSVKIRTNGGHVSTTTERKYI